MRPFRLLLLVLAVLLAPRTAAAQLPDPGQPGPYVIDLRGAFAGVPGGRGVGFDVGGHLYAGRLGPARLGLGVSLLRVTGGDGEDGTTTSIAAPQLSFNFGTGEGWSYLSAGYGRGTVGEFAAVPAINVGGGARWFVKRHLAVGFDLRFHRMSAGSASPSESTFAVAAGVSLR